MSENTLDLTKYEGHTPGPWRAWEDGEINDGCGQGNLIAMVMSVGDDDLTKISLKSRIANRRLIADAPALLARVRELEAEIERLRECAQREAKSKTISVELPSSENGLRFFVTAPWSTDEKAVFDSLSSAISLFAEVMGWNIKQKSISKTDTSTEVPTR